MPARPNKSLNLLLLERNSLSCERAPNFGALFFRAYIARSLRDQLV